MSPNSNVAPHERTHGDQPRARPPTRDEHFADERWADWNPWVRALLDAGCSPEDVERLQSAK